MEKDGVAGWEGMLKPETVLTGAWVGPDEVAVLVPPKNELGIANASGMGVGVKSEWVGRVVYAGWSEKVGSVDLAEVGLSEGAREG